MAIGGIVTAGKGRLCRIGPVSWIVWSHSLGPAKSVQLIT
jgi:hypothetical protein